MGCLAEMRRCYDVEAKAVWEDGISEALYPACDRYGDRIMVFDMVVIA